MVVPLAPHDVTCALLRRLKLVEVSVRVEFRDTSEKVLPTNRETPLPKVHRPQRKRNEPRDFEGAEPGGSAGDAPSSRGRDGRKDRVSQRIYDVLLGLREEEGVRRFSSSAHVHVRTSGHPPVGRTRPASPLGTIRPIARDMATSYEFGRKECMVLCMEGKRLTSGGLDGNTLSKRTRACNCSWEWKVSFASRGGEPATMGRVKIVYATCMDEYCDVHFFAA